MANGVYNRGKRDIMNGTIDLDGSTLDVLLVNSAYAFNADHHDISDIVANEISVAGYARQTLTTKSVTEDDTNDFAYLDADDSTFSGMAAGQTIGGAVLALHTGSDATSSLIAFYDLTDTPTGGADFVVQWAAAASGAILKGA